MNASGGSGGAGEGAAVDLTTQEVYVLPASFGQERILALDRQNPGDPTWNLAFRFRLQGPLDARLLERVFNAIVRRWEALRTTLRLVGGQPSQVIAGALEIAVPVIDLRHFAQPEQDAEVDRRSLEEARRRFDLASGPLLRVSLLRVADDEHVLCVTLHHAVADYWSIGLITDELGALYEAFSRGLPSPLAEPPVQYGDYAIWQREQAQSAAVRSELGYWKNRLSGLPLLDFPTDYPRGEIPTYNATIVSQLLPVALTDSLKTLANEHGATFFNLLLAALQIVLHQYTGQSDFGVGTQLAGRDRTELEKVVGLFINTIVLRTDLSGDPSFAELLERVRETGAQAIAHQNPRFEQLLKELRPADYPRHHTLFRVNFICQRDQVKPLDFAGIKLTVIPSKSQGALYDLNVFLVLRDDGWRLSCEYNPDLFAPESIARLLTSYRGLLGAIAENAERRVSEFVRDELPPRAVLEREAAPVPPTSSDAAEGPAAIAPEPEQAFTFPVSLAQRRFWFLEQLDPGDPAYNIAVRWRLIGSLDAQILERALNEVIGRQESLRTTFAAREGEPLQTVWPSARIELAMLDLRDVPSNEREVNVEELALLESRRPFDLAKAPILRASLLRLDEAEHVLLVSTHHIVSDGVSMGLIAAELGTAYESLIKGSDSAPPELPIQYADYAVWHRELIEHGGLNEEAEYWTRKLANFTPTELTSDKPRPARQSLNGEILGVALPRTLASSLKELSTRQGCTFFMTLLAAFKVLLYRYTLRTDITIGTQVAGRERPEFEDVVGVFINSLPLRTDLSGDPRFDEVLQRVSATVVEALAHQTMPFERLVDLLKIKRDASRNPLFQINFASHTAFIRNRTFAGVSLIDMPAKMAGALYDLNFFLVDRSDEWRLSCQYNTDLYETATVAAMLRHFQAVLEGVAANPEQLIHEIPLLSDDERHRVLVEWSGGASEYPRDALIHTLFEEQAERRPDATAIIWGERRLSYREVNGQANRLARYLRTVGVGPESLTGLCVERSPNAIIAMLAILKAGGAYVPLDPAYSPERLEFLIADTKMPVLVTQEALLGRMLSNGGAQIVCLEAAAGNIDGESDANLGSVADSSSLAYVMYTSGPAGRPNGVMVPHRAVVRLVKNANYVDIAESAVFLQLAALSLDAATFEIWAPLLNGARLAIMALELPSVDDLGRAIKQYGVTTLCLPTGLFHLIVDERVEILRPLRQLLIGGDVLSSRRVNRALHALPDCRLIHTYGPTENTTFTCCYTIPRDGAGSAPVPIGKPIANTQVWILDPHQQPAAVGMRGELYIGGDGLARGYLNRPELSGEKFVPHPFSSDADARLYKTGDLARYLPDGNLEFFGRAGDQVERGGSHLEAGETRSLSAQPLEVAQGAVPARAKVPVRQRIAAYLRRSAGNPKIDRSPPPASRDGGAAVDQTGIPYNDLQAQLLNIWEELIGIHPIGLSDNFFDLGGHSMLALRLFARIKEVWGTDLPLATLLQAPTVNQLAEVLSQNGVSAPRSVLVAVQVGGSRAPLYIASGLGGNVVRFYNLVRHLGSDQPVYALQPPGLNGEAPFLTSVEEQAALYISEIRKKQPQGPYFLVGYSFGGLVTFEMARQFAAQGQAVGLLALLDAPEWRYLAGQQGALKARNRLSRYREILGKILFTRQRSGYLTDRLRGRTISLIYSACRRLGLRLPQNLGTIQDMNLFAAAQYVPKPYAGRVTVFSTKPAVRMAMHDDTLGWGELALEGVEIHEIPGDHSDITSEPNVRVLSQKLALCLERAQRRTPQAGQSSQLNANFHSSGAAPKPLRKQIGSLAEPAAIKS